ncbi:MAG: CGLD27 family protein [Synechococcales cyanobacterium]
MSPIPDEQQPLNQFRELQDSAFFMWPSLPEGAFWWGIAKLWIPVLLVAGFLTASTLRLPQQWLSLGIISTCFAHLAVALILLRLYLGWQHIRQRLLSKQVVYEESGWYDGTVYQKTADEYHQEQLVAQYQVTPMMQRLQRYLAGFAALTMVELGVWSVL